MKTLPAGLQSHLDSGTTTLCWCWKIVRRDAVALGFTDHDEDVTLDALTYAAVSGFTAKPSDADFGKDKILSLAPVQIHSGTQVIHLVTAKPPKYAGIDPYNMWIDRNSDDNVVEVGN